MKQVSIIAVIVLLSQIAFCQSKIDFTLNKKLRVMFKEDQKWRKEYNKLSTPEKPSYDEKTIQKNWAKTDSLNLTEAKHILHRYGYPGYSIAGENGSSWFWAIVQHCDNDVKFQQEVLALMDKEVKRHNASGEDYAYLKDRVLVNQGQKQLYGTQAKFNLQTRKHTPFPIQDSLNIDTRRKAVGLPSLKDYIQQMDAM